MSTSRLPERASLDYLKKLAKERLRDMRAADPAAKLASAQLAVAREHGFPSWRALKAEVDRRRAPHLHEWFAAVEAKDLAAMRAMLEADPSLVRERDSGDNATALHFAAGGGHIEIVRLLLDAGADVNGFGDVHESDVIGWAAGDGVEPHRDVIALLLERGARHHILSAIALNDLALVESIVEENPDALNRRRSRFEQRQTPLHFALSAPDGLRTKPAQYEMADLLIELGADVEAVDDRGRTPLAVAMLRGDVEAMRRLRAAGAQDPSASPSSTSEQRLAAMRASMKYIVPMLCVPDVDATAEWLQSFGFTLEERHPKTGQMDWASLSFGKVWLMVQPRVARPQQQIALWFYTSGIDDLYDMFRARQLESARSAMAGGPAKPPAVHFLEDLYEPFYGGRQFSIRDPNGFELVFASDNHA
ncbi:MAG TPA: ankyrin repeat domain-containing protein [Gemmatimonadaceae bacterium]|nr:ankyrin repeat domain-containing protein [Gemmatimonadaceae bacterium]